MRKTVLSLMLLVLVATTAWAELVRRGPILITSDQDFTPENGVVGGWGVFGDPYIISGVRIDAEGDDYGILISGTIRPVLIRDVEVLGARTAGIKVQSARNVTIEDVRVRGCAAGISAFLSTEVIVSRAWLEECADGVRLVFSSGVDLYDLHVSRCRTGVWFAGTMESLFAGSVIEACDLGVVVELGCEGIVVAQNAFLGCRLPARSDGGAAWDDGVRGNYWEGFISPDEDGDGILDKPYPVGPEEEDRFPLASWPEP
ncbi:MAG: NosD domain-containing protein [Candidatus Bipolaricaulis sp.]|nr:NosD domain-containing protein [Candidatus Bipolaricaulis sp.]MDY0392153.1 NosD domain-containing protein [Candidatus Bipolaricaulis sp.]